jgi:hypothetical protein
MESLLDHIPNLERAGSTTGGEHAGPGPRCGGEDRVRVWPDHPDHDPGFFWCRRCEWSGDGINYLRQEKGYNFREACRSLGVEQKLGDPDPVDSEEACSSSTAPTKTDSGSDPDSIVSPPSAEWQRVAKEFAQKAQKTLWGGSEAAATARSYLHKERGLSKRTIREAGLGVHPKEHREPYEKWGFDESGRLWLPRGIVIPWTIKEEYWRVSIRRPPDDIRDEQSPNHKYHMVKGSCGKALYNAEKVDVKTDVVLVEGVFDALTIDQEVEGPIAVATGSTSGAQASKWRVLLSICQNVLVAFDSGEAGEEASEYWIDALPNADRWRPHDHDANELYLSGGDLADWVDRGLSYGGSSGTHTKSGVEEDKEVEGSPSDCGDSTGEATSDQTVPLNLDEEFLGDPQPGPVPASIPLRSGDTISIHRKEMRDGYPGVAFRLPYDEEFVFDLKDTVCEWAREWRPNENVWVIDVHFYEHVLSMVEYHYGIEWRQKQPIHHTSEGHTSPATG